MSPGGKAGGESNGGAARGTLKVTEVGLRLMVPVLQQDPGSLSTQPAPLAWSLGHHSFGTESL